MNLFRQELKRFPKKPSPKASLDKWEKYMKKIQEISEFNEKEIKRREDNRGSEGMQMELV